jgi:hypothetical protein
MYRSSRARRSSIALVVWAQACTVYRPAPANAPLPVGRSVRIRSAQPFVLGHAASAATLEPVCQVTAVGGDVVRVSGDTLLLARSRDITAAPGSDGSRRCDVNGRVALVLTPGMEVTQQRIHAGRTTALVLGIAAAALGFAAYAASNIDPGFPPSTGGTF